MSVKPKPELVPQPESGPELEFDGERFVPGAGVEITYHHWLRYLFAAQFAAGKRVLDIASGEGYGAAALAETAAQVDGFDADEAAVAHARATYQDHPRLSFRCAKIDEYFASAPPESYDLVTAFEILEHVDEPTQHRLLEGIRRVLAPGGVAVVSTPDKQLYSDVRLGKNPFHVRELYRNEFSELCESVFPSVRIFEQLTFTGSAVFQQGARQGSLAEMSWSDLLRLKGRARPGVQGGGEYLVAVLATDEAALQAIESIVLVDRSRKLISEEAGHLREEAGHLREEAGHLREEAGHLRDVVEDLERQNAELRRVWLSPDEEKQRRDRQQAVIDRQQAVIDRLVVQIERDAQARGADGDAADHLRASWTEERRRREHLEGMLSVRLILRAKTVWDRFPLVKRVVKRVVKT